MHHVSLVSIIGFAAAILNISILLPQVSKTLKTKRTRDISLMTFLLMVTTASLWVAYGLLTRTWPIVLANVCTLSFASIILSMKFRYK